MTNFFHNCVCLKWFLLVSSCFIQRTVSNHLENVSISSSETNTKQFCEKSEYHNTFVLEKSDFNNVSFSSQFFEIFLNSNISNQCKDSLVIYINEVINFKPWALEMLDASGKIPSSFFSITLIDYGSLDDCIKIKANSNDGNSLFKGKFCMIHLRHPLFQTPTRNPYIGKSYVEAFGEPPDWIRSDIVNYITLRFGYYGGICMPSTCTDEELDNVISALVEPLDLDVTLSDCQVEEPLKVSVAAKIVMIFLVVLLLVCVSGTILDLIDRKKESQLKFQEESLNRQLLKAFSFYTNTEELFTVRAKETSFEHINGMRAILSILIMWAHATVFPSLWKELSFRNFHFVFEFLDIVFENNAPIIVDCFFTISAFLFAFHTWKQLEKTKGQFSIFEKIVQRYCRLTPPLIFTMLLHFILPLFSSGPIWNSSWEHEQENCFPAGWKNLLYIQNYKSMMEICLAHTWYMASTMQLLIISLPLIIGVYRYPKTGLFLGLILYFVPIIHHYYHSIELQFPFASFNSVRYSHIAEEMASKVYVYTSYHLSSNLIGMLVGWVYFKYGKQKLTKMWILIGWSFSILCIAFTTLAVFIPTKDFRIMAFYNVTRNSALSLGTIWIVYICACGQGGVVRKIFSSKALVPLSRISYSVLMVHPLYLVFRDNSRTDRIYLDRISQVVEFVPYILFSIFAGFIAYIIIEEPFNKMYGILKERVTSSTPPPKDRTEISNGTLSNKNETEKL